MLDAVEVFEQIERATRTLKKLPRVGVKSRFCNWPEVIQNFMDAYGYTDPVPPKIVPTARQLTEMDQVIRWLAWLSSFGEEYPRIVWSRAAGASWRGIAGRVGLSPPTCKERFRIGVCAIMYAIEEKKVS
ncbi:DUF6362 family protein [Fimbriiglobus ruber]|uniref:DUF6362 domain-containing protein n=1 Tax=Fimbriiglobus ruber TaxID=1908690 RepID=A0A225DIK8_9BACT|nr:DUF6362 family protein [Fimbriiglobus ruber]OWK39534.1 hypothetical protein FRUB_06097 [Fimbriiglobus ruber]OWK42045.1 hypothetical protein FRUB_04123 [Fimbriiglobus ruber]